MRFRFVFKRNISVWWYICFKTRQGDGRPSPDRAGRSKCVGVVQIQKILGRFQGYSEASFSAESILNRYGALIENRFKHESFLLFEIESAMMFAGCLQFAICQQFRYIKLPSNQVSTRLFAFQIDVLG